MSNQAIGERAVGPMAKRTTSPQLGAVAGDMGSPKISTACRPASAVPMAQGAQRTSATAMACTAAATTGMASARPPTSAAPRARASATSTTSGRMAGANEALAAMMAPSTTIWPVGWRRQQPGQRGVEQGQAGGPAGQPGHDEGEGGVRDQPVPAAGAECAVGQREAEVADHRHHPRTGRRDQRPHRAARGRWRPSQGCSRAPAPSGQSPWPRRPRCPPVPASPKAGDAGAVVPTPADCQPEKK